MHQYESRANIGEVLCTTISALRTQMARRGFVESSGVQLSERVVGRVGKIDRR